MLPVELCQREEASPEEIQELEEWLKEFNVLYNVVDKRNTQHIEWLKHIGFTFSGEVIINGYKFLQFFKVKEFSQPTSKLVSETTN